jgi:hypothetical protein
LTIRATKKTATARKNGKKEPIRKSEVIESDGVATISNRGAYLLEIGFGAIAERRR